MARSSASWGRGSTRVTSVVAVDGQKIHAERPVYFAVNKPKGYVSTNQDPSGRPRVVDLLPEIPQRVYTIGRLDEMSTGLMLLTNDGELANKLAHPKYGVEKLYRALVAGSPGPEVLNQLTEGVWLAEGKVRAKRVRIAGKRGESTVLEMVLAEGKNREVRRMLAKLGHKVMTLTRVAVGPITLKGLAIGQYRPLSSFEIDLLRKVAAGLALPGPRFADRRPARPPTRGAARSRRGSRRRARADATGKARWPRASSGAPTQRRPGPFVPGGPRRTQDGPASRHSRRPGTPADGTAASASTSRGSPSVAARPGPSAVGGPRRPAGPAARPPSRPAMRQAPPHEVEISPVSPPPRSSPRTPPRPRPTGTQPPVPPTRRIIGMEGGGGREGTPGPRPRPPKRSFPRAALGKRRPRLDPPRNRRNDPDRRPGEPLVGGLGILDAVAPPCAAHRTVAVVENVPVARDTYRLRLDDPVMAGAIRPGQFLMIRPAAGAGTDPLLGRPFALYDVVRDAAGTPRALDVVYLVVGRGTAALAGRRPGDRVAVWGPLGNGFGPPPTGEVIFVAGGIGQTPFLALGRWWLGRASYGDVAGARAGPFASSARLLYGVRTADLAAGLDDFRGAGMDVELATDDGSAGHHGYVTDLLARGSKRASGRPRSSAAALPPCSPRWPGWPIGTGSPATSRSRTTWRAASASASAASPRSARPTARPTSDASASRARSSPAPTSPEASHERSCRRPGRARHGWPRIT